MNTKIRSIFDHTLSPSNLKIYEFTKIINPEFIFVGDNVIIDDFTLLNANKESIIEIGSWVHITNFSSLSGGPIKIGNFCGISSGCRIIAGTEQYQNGALMNPPIPPKYRSINKAGCVMENFSFLSANCVLFPGVTVKEGAIAGAGSVIREDLGPWGVYVMKNGKMVKVGDRNKEQVYQNAKNLLQEVKDNKTFKILFFE